MENKHTQKEEKTPTARDSYKELVSKIISDLEKGVEPWKKSWNLKNGIPQSAITGGEYSGINLISLLNNEFKSNKWLTANQVLKLGGSIKDEEVDNNRDIYFLKDILKMTEEKNKDTGEIEKVQEKKTILRNYKVYNSEQVNGIIFENTEDTVSKNQHILEIEEFIKSLDAKILRGEPAYSSYDDYLFMPHIDEFKDKENYYSTLFHEISHWTGHKSRLNREKHISKYDDTYAIEELIAELSSAFLCTKHKISSDKTQHSEYLASWISSLKENPYILFTVSSQASKATNFLNKLSNKNINKSKTKYKKTNNSPKVV